MDIFGRKRIKELEAELRDAYDELDNVIAPARYPVALREIAAMETPNCASIGKRWLLWHGKHWR